MKELADSRWSRKTCRRQSTVRKVCKKRGKRSKKATPDRNIGLRTGTVGILLCGQDRNDQRISGSKTTGITVYAAETIWKDVENCASHSRYFSDELDAQFF